MFRCCSFSVAAALALSLCATSLTFAKPAAAPPMTSRTLASLEEVDGATGSIAVLRHHDWFGNGQRIHWDLVLIG
jgi:hypothetical protein